MECTHFHLEAFLCLRRKSSGFVCLVLSGLVSDNMQLLVRLYLTVHIIQSSTYTGCYWSANKVFCISRTLERFNCFSHLSSSFWRRKTGFVYILYQTHPVQTVIVLKIVVFNQFEYRTKISVGFLPVHYCLEAQQTSPFDVCDCMCPCQHMCHQFDAGMKQYTPLLFMTLIVWDIRMKKMKER